MALYQQAGEILVNDIPGPFLYNRTQTVARESEGDRLHGDGARCRSGPASSRR